MLLEEFLARFDREGSVVLLEGKRAVAEQDREKLIALGRLLAEKTIYTQFRSGNAPGADELFSEGVIMVDPKRLEVITPYKSHRKKNNKAYTTYSLDEIDVVSEPEVIYHSKTQKKNSKLVDAYVAGDKNALSAKAAYLIRDTMKVLGTSEIPRASFGIFYNDLGKPLEGGTGHTIAVCRENGVETIDQETWFNWF
jgi:hypothetical protein